MRPKRDDAGHDAAMFSRIDRGEAQDERGVTQALEAARE
jgi:hypothetical protein